MPCYISVTPQITHYDLNSIFRQYKAEQQGFLNLNQTQIQPGTFSYHVVFSLHVTEGPL